MASVSAVILLTPPKPPLSLFIMLFASKAHWADLSANNAALAGWKCVLLPRAYWAKTLFVFTGVLGRLHLPNDAMLAG